MLKEVLWKYLSSSVVRAQHSHCWSPGSIPGQETKIPQAVQLSQKIKEGRKDGWMEGRMDGKKEGRKEVLWAEGK